MSSGPITSDLRRANSESQQSCPCPTRPDCKPACSCDAAASLRARPNEMRWTMQQSPALKTSSRSPKSRDAHYPCPARETIFLRASRCRSFAVMAINQRAGQSFAVRGPGTRAFHTDLRMAMCRVVALLHGGVIRWRLELAASCTYPGR